MRKDDATAPKRAAFKQNCANDEEDITLVAVEQVEGSLTVDERGEKEKGSKKKLSPKQFLQKKAVSALGKFAKAKSDETKAAASDEPVSHRTREGLKPPAARTRQRLAATRKKYT